MKKLLIILILTLMPLVSIAEFKYDLTVDEFNNQRGITTIDQLLVGEIALVQNYQLDTCITPDGTLIVSGDSKINHEKVTNYGGYFEIKKKVGNIFSIDKSRKGTGKPDILSVISHNVSCEVFIMLHPNSEFKLYEIESINGSTSLKELLKNNVVEDVKSDNASHSTLDADEYKPSWRESKSTSDIDDSNSVTLSLSSNSFKRSLILRCKENKTNAYITTKFVSGDSTATFRIDTDAAYNSRVDASTKYNALFIRQPIKFIKKLLSKDKLVFRYSEYKGGTDTLVFNISGLNDVITPLQTACHWK